MTRPPLLLLTPYSVRPPWFGSSERNWFLAQGLNATFDVHVLATTYRHSGPVAASPPPPGFALAELPARARWAQFFNLGVLVQALRFIRTRQPVALVAGHLWASWQAYVLHRLTGVPLVLDAHNVEGQRLRGMNHPLRAGIAAWEAWLVRRVAQLWAVSEGDARQFASLGVPANRLVVVPNGADVAQFRPHPPAGQAMRARLGLAPNTPLVLFFGKLDYAPNAQAMQVLAQHIAPAVLAAVPQAVFAVAGHGAEAAPPPLRPLGFVADLPALINAATVMVAPLLAGGGTKIKIVQSLACGCPVITTPAGAEGIAPTPPWLMVEPDVPAVLARTLAVVRAPQRPALAEALAVREAYAWTTSARQASAALASLVKDNL